MRYTCVDLFDPFYSNVKCDIGLKWVKANIPNICNALGDLVPFHLYNALYQLLKPGTLLKITFLHRCLSRFLNCTNGTKSRNAPRIGTSRLTCIANQLTDFSVMGLLALNVLSHFRGCRKRPVAVAWNRLATLLY